MVAGRRAPTETSSVEEMRNFKERGAHTIPSFALRVSVVRRNKNAGLNRQRHPLAAVSVSAHRCPFPVCLPFPEDYRRRVHRLTPRSCLVNPLR